LRALVLTCVDGVDDEHPDDEEGFCKFESSFLCPPTGPCFSFAYENHESEKLRKTVPQNSLLA